MDLFDIRTIIFSHVITNTVCLIVVITAWFRDRNRFAGLDFWLASYSLQLIAILLIALRGIAPDFLSIVVSNSFIIAGAILLYVGLEFFAGKRTSQIHNYALLGGFIFIHSYFTFVYPSLLARTINLSVGIILLCSQCAWLLIRRVAADMQPVTRGAGYVFLAFCLFAIARILVDLVVKPGTDFFRSGIFEALAVLVNQTLIIVLTFQLLLIVNRRLVVDLERDILQRVQVEEALHESERRYFSLFENMLSGYAYCRMIYESGQPQDFICLQVNGAFEKLTGLKNVIGKRVSEVIPGIHESNPELLEIPLRISVTGKPEKFEMYVNALANWFSISIYSPEPEHFMFVFENITERKLLEESLHHRNDILAASNQVMIDFVDRHDVDDILQTLLVKIGVVLDVSDVSIDLVENNDTLVTYAATPGQPLVKGDTMRRGEGGWLSWQAVETGQPAVLEDYFSWPRRRELYEGFPIHAIAIIPIHHRDHVIGTINFSRREPGKSFNATDIYAADQLAQMIALVLDNAELYAQLQSELAERKRVEENLRESRENFQRYFNMSTVGMCVTSSDRHWIEANGRLRQMLGYSDEELANLTWGEIAHPDDVDPDLTFYNQILANERDSYQVDKRFVRKDGSILYTTLFVTCQRNPDGKVRYLLLALIDITDRKQAEESLLKLAAIEERQRLARDLHDSVNQSIHGLVLFSETLISTLEKNNIDRARQIADRLQESARQALKETRLMLYEMQASSLERNVDLIPDLEARLATVERRAGVRAQILQEGSLAHCPRAWHENLFWIAIEALNNALKHAQARNMQIKINFSPNRMELEVIDDGIGFDPNKPRLGGLGLQNMRDRAGLLGGELTILSTPPKGSCVRFNAEIKE